MVGTLYWTVTWIWSTIPWKSSFEPTGLTFHSVSPERRLCCGRGRVNEHLWSSLLFSEMKEALNSDNATRHVCFWLLINISFYILNSYGPPNRWRWKRIRYEAIPLQDCFSEHTCSRFVQLRLKRLGSWPLPATSQLQRAPYVGWAAFSPVGGAKIAPFQDERKSNHYLPSGIGLLFSSQK